MTRTGGCQCGAVRFRVEGELGGASLCHCRMCQKAFGGPFGGLVTVPLAQLVWTRGARKRFQSSGKVWRGFCGDCGTPLTYEAREGEIEVAICAFDQPVTPTVQLSVETALPWAGRIEDLPQRTSHWAGVVSRQHPDHDTAEWPPRE